jgi:hypothetical protein
MPGMALASSTISMPVKSHVPQARGIEQRSEPEGSCVGRREDHLKVTTGAGRHGNTHHLAGTTDAVEMQPDFLGQLIEDAEAELLSLPGAQHGQWPLRPEGPEIGRRYVGPMRKRWVLFRRQELPGGTGSDCFLRSRKSWSRNNRNSGRKHSPPCGTPGFHGVMIV